MKSIQEKGAIIAARAGQSNVEQRAPTSADRIPASAGVLLFFAFLGVALFVYEPALEGRFVSDDNHYIKNNSYVHELSVENLVEIFDPFGDATIAIVNYSPVQLFIHTLAWEAFGSDVEGHHVVNVVLHALASVLLVFVLQQSGISREGALLGGAFFLLHPANVEAVAWISQLKSTSATVLSLLALLAFAKRPALATLSFAAALLAKATAAVALPVAALLAWTRRERLRWGWLALWAALFATFSIVEFDVHQRSGAAEAVLYDTPLVLVRTMMALAMRYLVIGATSVGVSAFHEPDPAESLLDPWWLASIPALGVLGIRTVVVARRRSPEFAFWIWALVSFGPVSQIFPFLYPLGDRYLYFILPGLIGGTLFAGRDLLDWLCARGAARSGGDAAKLRARTGVAVAVAVAIALIPLAWHAHARAGIWRNAAFLVVDAAKHYPNGVSAHLLAAKRAARDGDGAAAAAAVRAAHARGFNQFDQLLRDRTLGPVLDHPEFRQALREMAQGWIDSIGEREQPSQGELRMQSRAYIVQEDYEQAAAALRRALAIGGRHDDQIRVDLQALATRIQ